MFVKICGIANAEDAQAVAELQPDAMGFIFWSGSPRCVQPGDVRKWMKEVPPTVLRIGVFVDEEPEVINKVIARAGLNIVQLHGSEARETVRRISGLCWKVVHLDRMGVEEADAYPVMALLIDKYNDEMPGGTGEVADWEKAAQFVEASKRKVMLAGGLNPENVGEAIRQVRPFGVDVSSGVEREPGRKDLEKVEAFIRESRAADEITR